MVGIDADLERRLQAVIDVLKRNVSLRAVYLFGSYASGQQDRWSDIDLGVFFEGAESWDLTERVRLFVTLQKQVGHDIEPHFFSARAVDHPQPGSFAAEVMKQGIRIH